MAVRSNRPVGTNPTSRIRQVTEESFVCKSLMWKGAARQTGLKAL
jgi:hypothetical protein